MNGYPDPVSREGSFKSANVVLSREQEIQRYREAQSRIIAQLKLCAMPVKYEDGALIQPDSKRIWIMTESDVEIRRVADDLLINIELAPVIIGLGAIFGSPSRYYYKIHDKAQGYFLSVEEAVEKITEKNLWRPVAQILSAHLNSMVQRDEQLVSKQAYDTIRAKILEYLKIKDRLDAHDINLIPYIQDSTLLSRSMIYKIFSWLVEKGYVVMERGKLISVYYLPEKF